MPIKFLTGRGGDVIPRFGAIAKGDTAPTRAGGANRPIDLDYFRFRFAEGYEHLQAPITDLLGDKPKSIEVILIPVYPQNDPLETYFPHSMQAWAKGGLMVDCDGETVLRHYNQQRGAYDTTPHTCQFADGKCPQGCKPTGRLKVVIPQIISVAGLGYFSLTTHGKADIDQIIGALSFCLMRSIPIDSVLWNMARIPKKTTYKDDRGAERTRDVHPVQLTLITGGQSLFGSSAQPQALPHTDVPMLVSSNDADDFYADDEGVPIPEFVQGLGGVEAPPPPKKSARPNPAVEGHELGKSVIAHLTSAYRSQAQGVTADDVIFVLGFNNWAEVSRDWEGRYPNYPRTLDGICKAYLHIVNEVF